MTLTGRVVDGVLIDVMYRGPGHPEYGGPDLVPVAEPPSGRAPVGYDPATQLPILRPPRMTYQQALARALEALITGVEVPTDVRSMVAEAASRRT